MTQRVDAAGTTSFTWTARHELDTLSEPITGTVLDYTWDDASQLTDIEYGPTGAHRTYMYDDRGRLTSDTLIDDTSTAVASVTYGYDSDSQLTSKNVTLAANGDAGNNTYSYDLAGRLESWTDPSSVTTTYTWDSAGNRTGAGSDTYTYDQRNRLLTGPEGDYTYTARGTLDTIDTTREYSFDPFGRLTDAEGTTYSYDGLDRISSRGSTAFTYNGPGLDPVSDGSQTFTRTPDGRIVAISDDTTDLLTGLDRHGDLTHLFGSDGTVTDTSLYTPFGEPLDATGTFGPTAGFQGDWTDPTTSHVWQGARWYQPALGTFLSRDTLIGELTTPISLNRYTYAFASPLDYWDPDGRFGAPNTDLLIDGMYGKGCVINSCHTNTNQTVSDQKKEDLLKERNRDRAATPATSSNAASDAAITNALRRRAELQQEVSQEMQAYLEARGGLVDGWETASFRDQYNLYAWTLLRNTGRTNLTHSQFRNLPDSQWTALWAAQGDAAHQDIYMRECSFWCRNKDTIRTGIIAAAAGLLTAGATAALAPAAWGSLTTATVASGTSGLGSSLTSQALTGEFSLRRTLIETAVGVIGGVGASRLTSVVSRVAGGSGTAAGLADDGVNLIPSSGRTFVVTSKGTVYDIPEGWVARVADNGRGIVYQRPGATGNADMIRIMSPTAKYPSGYVRYYNEHGQPLDVFGRPGSGSTHIPQDYRGPWPGWPG